MKNKQLKKGDWVTINVPFSYEIGEPGFNTGNIINDINDCKLEVAAEIDSGNLNGSDLLMVLKDEAQ